MKLSVIIPTYHEEGVVGGTVRWVRKGLEPGDEVIVCDGGSANRTVQEASEAGARVLCSPHKGRAAQLNHGAANALGEVLMQEAFAALRNHDAVIGPSVDGGYYLLGLNAPCTDLFQRKRWSTSSVFADTSSDLLMHGRSCYLLPELRDIDTEEDLQDAPLPEG